MIREKRARRLKALLGAEQFITVEAQQMQRFRVEAPGYSLRAGIRAESPEKAINQAVQRWVRSGELNPATLGDGSAVGNEDFSFESSAPSGSIRIKVTNMATKDSSEAMVPVEKALAGETGYMLPDFGGYSDRTENLEPNVEERSEQAFEPDMSMEERSKRDETMEKVDDISVEEPHFHEPKVFLTDPSIEFLPETVSDLLYRAKNKAWITIPAMAKKRGISNLYELGGEPSDHEKYFGIKAREGYLHTPASAILHHLATKGGASRGNMRKLKKLKVPEDHPRRSQLGEYLLTLPVSVEQAAVRESYGILQEAHQNPDLLRRLNYKKNSDSFEYTTSHSRGIRETDPHEPLSPELEYRLTVTNRGLAKPIAEYRKLNSMVSEFITSLNDNQALLLKEMYAKNPTIRFTSPSGKKDETQDILKNILLRKIISAIQHADLFSEGDAIFQESDYTGLA